MNAGCYIVTVAIRPIVRGRIVRCVRKGEFKLPGYTTVNTFLQFRPIERVQLSLNANNLFNVKGFTEAEDASIPANGIVRARSINGRTVSAAVRLSF
jgi:outer membrane receptor protein involved in Fe transport